MPIEVLGMRHAIVQGPFGGGLSTTRLAATVSNLGGLGSFGAHMLAPEAIEGLARELRALTAEPFAINLWVSDHDPGGVAISRAAFDAALAIFRPFYRELGLDDPEPPASGRYHPEFAAQIEALLEARPPVFSFVFGIPSAAILAECRRRGIATIGAATTLAEARALDEAGVDAIVASGFEAGGHRPSFLARAEDSLMGTFALTPLVADRVRAPVIAAGGIVDRRGVVAARALGAAAVQVGTAFLACEESGAAPAHKALLFDPRAEATTLTRAFTGRLARGLVNRWTELDGAARELLPFPVQSWFVAHMKRAALEAGRTDLISLWGGQAAPNLRHHTAQALMESLLEENRK
jgi:nitronate monooxygenase